MTPATPTQIIFVFSLLGLIVLAVYVTVDRVRRRDIDRDIWKAIAALRDGLVKDRVRLADASSDLEDTQTAQAHRMGDLENAVAELKAAGAPEALPTGEPELRAHTGHCEVERLSGGSWVHHDWVREGSKAAQHALDKPGLRLKYYTGRADEGNQE